MDSDNCNNKRKDSILMLHENETFKETEDKYNIVYSIIIFCGILVILPWNVFITIRGYFVDYKLSESYTGTKTNLATFFVSNLSIISQVPSLCFEYLNLIVRFKGDLKKRIEFILIVQIILFLINTLLAIFDTSKWPTAFFIITMVTVFFINMSSGIIQNSLYGLSVLLPPNYISALIIGTNISGIFSSLLLIIIFSTSVSYETIAICCFSSSSFLLLVLFVVLTQLSKNKFYTYYMSQMKEAEKFDKKKIYKVIKKIKIHIFNIFLIFLVTLSCFPTIVSEIKAIDKDIFQTENLFSVVTCFLIFNVSTTIGSILAKYIRFPNITGLTILIMVRIIFIPLLLFCNYRPNNIRHLPVLFNDAGYIILNMLLGLTSGHFSTLSFQYLILSLKDEYKQIGGMLGGIALITGVFIGVFTSALYPYLISSF